MMAASDNKLRGIEVDEGITVADAIERWHVYCSNVPNKLAESTMVHHRRMGQELLAFLEPRKITHLKKITNDLMDEWRATWKVAESTQLVRAQRLSGFLNYCVNSGKLIRSPLLKASLQIKVTKEDTKPLDIDGTEKRYRKLIAAIEAGAGEKKAGANGGRRRPMLLRRSRAHRVAITELMYESGMRIGDATKFDIAELEVGENCARYTYMPTKTKRKKKEPVTTFIPLKTVERLKELPLPARGTQLFFEQAMGTLAAHEKVMNQCYQACGLGAIHAHQLRNSFAVRKLKEGMSLLYVSRCLGHSSTQTTQEYYMPWVDALVDAAEREYIKTEAAREQCAAEAETRPARTKVIQIDRAG